MRYRLSLCLKSLRQVDGRQPAVLQCHACCPIFYVHFVSSSGPPAPASSSQADRLLNAEWPAAILPHEEEYRQGRNVYATLQSSVSGMCRGKVPILTAFGFSLKLHSMNERRVVKS